MSESIVCMIRGGASGRLVQEQGIRLAKERGARLIFIHVVDVAGLGLENSALQEAARAEMTWLAWVTLNLANRRVRSSGVEVEQVIRYGNLFDSMLEYLKENPAQQLLMGSPHPDLPDYEERLAKVRQFARQIEDQTGILVDIVS